MGHSVLDVLGQEVTGIVSPVSLCMALTVLLVRLLNPTGSSDAAAVQIASAYYTEQDGDSTATKLGGSILNALIFVAIVTLMTFVLVLLFKYGYTKLIYAYMAVAGFSIFFVLAGIIGLQLLNQLQVPLDVFSYTYFLYNFSVVGVVILFFWPAPISLKQGYLIVTGIIVAYIFTFIPEWTTWTLLLAMALYDICAVLVPGGPLKMLVELAQERNAEIPALVYEARPTARGRRERAEQALLSASEGSQTGCVLPPLPARGQNGPGMPAVIPDGLMLPTEGSPGAADRRESQRLDAANFGARSEQVGLASADISNSTSQSGSDPAAREVAFQLDPDPAEPSRFMDDRAPLLSNREAAESSRGAHKSRSARSELAHIEGPTADLSSTLAPALSDGSSGSQWGLPDAIKLGLGDFIFYSVLVGRAAMYDMLTVFAAYLAIIAGLGMTLMLLALHRHALPALPLSIVLGVSFYFASRLLLEPFILPLSTHLLYF